MLMSRQTTQDGAIVYLESDGQPMSDNTRQFHWIQLIAGNLMALFRDRPDVFACGNQNWYPVEGEPDVKAAPDAYVVLGRPKGHRGSYKQWEEGGVPMTVVFEVLSPSNTLAEMANKLLFYEDYGAEEYYVYDPDNNELLGYVRQGSVLLRQRKMDGFVSPRLGITFDLSGPELVIRYPDGRPFLPLEEIDVERRRAEERAEQAEQQRQLERQRAEQAERRAGEEHQRAEQAERWAARLAELSRKALRHEATPDEAAELERLLKPPVPSADNDKGAS
jgi:Uma2 family endonuclease